jgi:hypothetical protein
MIVVSRNSDSGRQRNAGRLHCSGKRRDSISPVNATRTASVEIGVGEAPVQLQAREDALKEDAALSTGTRSAAPRQTEAANR